jgi:N-acylneuraminate cytidylyltransferase
MIKKDVIAVIPARGGSKRILDKNLLDFLGKPMIAWTIEAALKANIFDRILVSTDDEEIAYLAEKYGLEVPFLRTEYHDDVSPVSLAVIFALQQLQTILKEEYKIVVQLMATCPLRTAENIMEAYENFVKKGNLFQISCFEFGWMNPWWAAQLDEKMHPAYLFPEALKKRSQDLPLLFCPTGAIWIAEVNALRNVGTFYGEPLAFHPMGWKAAVDINDMTDVEMAKTLYHITLSSD